ncbi:MAG: F0F1 ATP synthase subunit A, partial [Patescibacteria group bacterium]|nr:F0F1 ATP synthase subunit A [Patescibacteria group bacterium]
MAVPVAAEKIFEVGGMPITNSLLNGWVAVLAVVVLAVALNRKTSLIPRGLQNVAEKALEFLLDFMDQVTHDRTKSRRFLPIAGTLFLFILFSNWLGLIPGVGTIGFWEMENGKKVLIPLFRAATSDLNLTLAMGISAIVISHVVGVATIGFFKYWGKFIQVAGVWRAIHGITRKPLQHVALDVFVACIEVMVGIIELISEVAKMISLSLRLFGNVFAGEVLLWVFLHLLAFIVPIPFLFMELIVGVVQAMIFSTLTLVYLTVATDAPHGSE